MAESKNQLLLYANIENMTKQEIYQNLCLYDKRNPDNPLDEYETIEDLSNCFCDNCFYGRNKLALELIKTLNEISEIRLNTVEI